MNAPGSRPPLSSYRFREMNEREPPAKPEADQAKPATEKVAPQEAAHGRYAELSQAARSERQENRFAANSRDATHGAPGQERAQAKPEPMRKDAPPLDQLKEKPQGQARGNYPQPTPGGTLWSHAPGASRSQTQAQARDNPQGRQGPGEGNSGSGRKLDFFEDLNPQHDRTPGIER